ncbi:Roy1p Ecym_2686 [Eremothecium cymbalariae DBVPG|uniref:F-box domain-containing protein n=1 Tax=Eremothecium cymbalariae (strain CBS 270.75 / DBVPG 7215 / KCTC 17166 / NRRL Y-17582) TaxID=931890 RepID=G8JPC9_ERECY|nr:Hypothetical protein Ecym_2686 [Eremothecium cymbalariae DBVPG\
MGSRAELKIVFTEVCKFLTQNDLVNLARTSKWFCKEVALPSLYNTIVICKDPVLRDDRWALDSGRTYLSGYRAIKKTADQNDLMIYDRIERLLESSHLVEIKTLVIQKNNFADVFSGRKLLQRLIDKLLELDRVENFCICDDMLFQTNYQRLLKLSNLSSVRIVNLEDLNILTESCVKSLKSLQLVLTTSSFKADCLCDRVKTKLLPNIEELFIDDIEFSGLRLFQYLQSESISLGGLRSLKFSHVHGLHDYNKILRELTSVYLSDVVPLNKLLRLELEFSCEMSHCDCADNFVMDLAARLPSLKELGLIERTFATLGSHSTEEKWDLWACKFILHIPQVSDNLRKLSIRHNTPLNGIITDAVEGNYLRRRTLYAHTLPKLHSLTTLIAPSVLQSLSAYEILVCDLLWNGCDCIFCSNVMDVFDRYLMNHQFYCTKSGMYKDLIPTVLFAYAGDAMSQRIVSEVDWTIKLFSLAPISHTWNMHGYEQLNHFHDFECLYDESVYLHLVTVISHFLNGYMDNLVKILPSLRRCLLSGVYYLCDAKGSYNSMYD